MCGTFHFLWVRCAVFHSLSSPRNHYCPPTTDGAHQRQSIQLIFGLSHCKFLKMESGFKLFPTKVFYVLDTTARNSSCRNIEHYKVDGVSKFSDSRVKQSLSTYGCCVRKNILLPETIDNARKKLGVFAKKLISSYDEVCDEFVDVDCEELCIERMPRIGKGKHNIHFCSLMSKEHKLVAKMADEARFSEVLTDYMGKLCTLRETGISLTRPVFTSDIKTSVADIDIDLICSDDSPSITTPTDNSDNKNNPVTNTTSTTFAEAAATTTTTTTTKNTKYNIAGEGMEWHADGAKGEATVLMAVEDIDECVGSLRLVPKSHHLYVDGTGHTEDILKNSAAWLAEQEVIYEYRAGQPMMIDARTLHSVSRNSSDKWRMIIWHIYDCY